MRGPKNSCNYIKNGFKSYYKSFSSIPSNLPQSTLLEMWYTCPSTSAIPGNISCSNFLSPFPDPPAILPGFLLPFSPNCSLPSCSCTLLSVASRNFWDTEKTLYNDGLTFTEIYYVMWPWNCPLKKNDRISHICKCLKTTYIYIKVRPSSGSSKYDGSKGGNQMTFLYSDKAHVGRTWDGSTKHQTVSQLCPRSYPNLNHVVIIVAMMTNVSKP